MVKNPTRFRPQVLLVGQDLLGGNEQQLQGLRHSVIRVQTLISRGRLNVLNSFSSYSITYHRDFLKQWKWRINSTTPKLFLTIRSVLTHGLSYHWSWFGLSVRIGTHDLRVETFWFVLVEEWVEYQLRLHCFPLPDKGERHEQEGGWYYVCTRRTWETTGRVREKEIRREVQWKGRTSVKKDIKIKISVVRRRNISTFVGIMEVTFNFMQSHCKDEEK